MDITPYVHSRSGGIKTYLRQKSFFMERVGFEHILVIPAKTGDLKLSPSTKVIKLSSFPLMAGYRFFLNPKEILRVVGRERPHLVEMGGTYLILHVLKGIPEVPTVVFYHSDAVGELYHTKLPSSMKKILLSKMVEAVNKYAHTVLVPSRQHMDSLVDLGVRRELLRYLPLGVDTNVFYPNPQYRKDVCRVIYVGRLSHEKGVDIVLKAFSLLPPEDYTLTMVGAGPLEDLVRKEASRRPNVRYLGYVEDPESLADIYRQHHVLVTGSRYETFGYSLVEAQGCGLVVAGFNIGVETQLIKDTLAEDYSPEALAISIQKACAIASYETALHLHTLVKENFSWENTFKNLTKLYEEVCHGVHR